MLKLIKKEYINNEILTLTIFGGLGRGYPVYKEGTQDKSKNDLKNFLRKELTQYGRNYKNGAHENHHIKNIERFTQAITRKYHEILKDNQFRIGRAQKLLNLYLKYLWVLDMISEPPHCPFDNKIISELGLNIKWTKLNSMEDYKELVKKAKKMAKNKNLSIAEWELKMWN